MAAQHRLDGVADLEGDLDDTRIVREGRNPPGTASRFCWNRRRPGRADEARVGGERGAASGVGKLEERRHRSVVPIIKHVEVYRAEEQEEGGETDGCAMAAKKGGLIATPLARR